MTRQLAPGPLFAVGVWRSGTSLLYALLNQHPQIALLYEGDLPVLKTFFYRGLRSHWKDRWDFWAGAVRRHLFSPADLPASPRNAMEATNLVYRQFAAARDAVIWGDKSPTYRDELLRLAEDFPSARFLIIWRNPLGFSRSIVNAAASIDGLYFRRPGILNRSLFGYREMYRQTRELKRRGRLLHEVHFEALVSNPESVLRGVCEFLEIDFVPQMLSLKDADRSAIMGGKHHQMVKSEKIAPGAERPEVLPAEWKAKIERYIRLWKRESGGAWPVYPGETPDGEDLPSGGEQLKDRILYRAFRWSDWLVLFLYSFIPIHMLQNYRARKMERARQAEPAAGN
jgi:hypothetical protein